MKCAACLATGNTAIVKSSEKTPLAVLFFGKLTNEAGFPPGVFQALAGAGETGALLASHMGIDKISFTGSVGTGKKIAQAAAASNLKKVTLELGGKSPSIIFPDANLNIAVEWCTRGITINAGQACIASSVVYVHKDIREKFLNMMKEAFRKLDHVIGDPDLDSTQISTVVDKIQFDRIMEYIEGGKDEATLITGGERIGDKVIVGHHTGEVLRDITSSDSII
jgi:acyl-CoA reductase-like NAD-dependent aldehyde dehydrogenase